MPNALQRHARAQADPKRARVLAGYFKTGPGEYGEGDVFLGLTVPQVRGLAAEGRDAGAGTLRQLLRSRYHEERLLGLLILVGQYERGDGRRRADVARFYLANLRSVDNWDLVDLSAPRILGPHWEGRPARRRDALARSPDLWRRRVAVMSTFHEIGRGRFAASLRLARALLDDPEDLIHKAVGWMLREVGKRDVQALRRFLRAHAPRMPRTALRYAIERLPARERKAWLAVRRAR
ncbi:MAG TPA: DNA alkylation repair protein [Gemmatimonadales bacterium]|nr:DNA alkylation repair protein [Gemmatimonadales bacterium]